MLEFPYTLDQVRTMACSKNWHTAGDNAGMLINVGMNVNYDWIISKRGLWKATSTLAWTLLLEPTAVVSWDSFSSTLHPSRLALPISRLLTSEWWPEWSARGVSSMEVAHSWLIDCMEDTVLSNSTNTYKKRGKLEVVQK